MTTDSCNNTVNPLYTDIRYKDKIRYYDNLNGLELSLRRWQLIRYYARPLYLILQETYVLAIC